MTDASSRNPPKPWAGLGCYMRAVAWQLSATRPMPFDVVRNIHDHVGSNYNDDQRRETMARLTKRGLAAGNEDDGWTRGLNWWDAAVALGWPQGEPVWETGKLFELNARVGETARRRALEHATKRRPEAFVEALKNAVGAARVTYVRTFAMAQPFASPEDCAIALAEIEASGVSLGAVFPSQQRSKDGFWWQPVEIAGASGLWWLTRGPVSDGDPS